MDRKLQVEETRLPSGLVVLRLVGGLWSDTTDKVVVAAKARLDQGYRKVLFDCSNVDHADTKGIGGLIEAYQEAQKVGASIGLLKPSERLKDRLHITKLDEYFEMFDTVEEAEEALGKS